MFGWLKNKQKTTENIHVKTQSIPKDELEFLHQYLVYGSYSKENKTVRIKIDKLFDIFKNKTPIPTDYGVYIKSIFNGVIYPTFDLDTIDHKDTFVKIYSDVPYVLFQSSPDHFWGILGNENKNIFTDTFWLSCNDQNYVNIAKASGNFLIRGLYEKLERKPILFNTNGILPENFQKFINTYQSYINNEALELSILKYKDTQMMLKFDRRKKLKAIDEQIENNNKLEEI